MSIFQDLVLLHAQKDKENFPVHPLYEEDLSDHFIVKLVAFGFAIFVALATSIIFSIPDKARQEANSNAPLSRDFGDESCHSERPQSGIRNVGTDNRPAIFQTCDY